MPIRFCPVLEPLGARALPDAVPLAPPDDSVLPPAYLDPNLPIPIDPSGNALPPAAQPGAPAPGSVDPNPLNPFAPVPIPAIDPVAPPSVQKD